MLGRDIRDLVTVKMDEYTPYGPSSSTPLLAGGDHLNEVKPIYSYTDETLHEAANEALSVIPIWHLTPIAIEPSSSGITVIDADDLLIGTITKPNNWLRLHTLQMAGWVRPVHDVVRPGTSKYNQQFTRWKRGTPQKPIVTDDGRVLHYYSQPRTAQAGQILTLKYITIFNESIDYPSKVAEVIALYCARKICEIYGMTEQLGIMTNEINGVLENMQR